VEIRGSARPRSGFMHVDDLADAVILLMKTWSAEEPINIGTRTDVTITDRAQLISDTVGFTRCLKAGRNPAQAPRRLQTDQTRLASAHRPESGNTPNPRVVPNLPHRKALTATVRGRKRMVRAAPAFTPATRQQRGLARAGEEAIS
jgi:hypothetical protein